MGKDKGKTNVASSGYTPIQVGRVAPPAEGDATPAQPKKAKTPGKSTNIVSGNARVGMMTDVVVGDLHINMGDSR